MIRIETKLTSKAYIKLMYMLSLRSPATWIVIFGFLLSMVVVYMRLFMGYKRPAGQYLNWEEWAPSAVVIYYLIATYRRSKRHYDTNAGIGGNVVYEFDVEKIKMVSEISIGESNWKMVNKVLELKNWMLIYTSNKTAFMIPSADFGSQLPEFRTLVRNAGVKTKLRN